MAAEFILFAMSTLSITQVKSRRAALLSSLGAGLEYYDFIIYGMMADRLSVLFFSGDEPWLALMKAFGIFAVGYLLRPFGGLFFGMIGDAYGRKKAFVSVMLLMATATFAIGLLPTYEQIGPTAAILLLLLRACQGLSFGAELPGAITVVYESTEERKRGCYSGLVISSVVIGSILASLVLYCLSAALSPGQVMLWGWRIPFLLGGLLAVASYYIRRRLQETPEYTSFRADHPEESLKIPLRTLLGPHRQEIFTGIGLTWLVASLVIFSLYMPTYLTEYYNYAPGDIYLAMTCGMVWCTLILPLCGQVADFCGKKKVLVATCALFALFAWALFLLLDIGGLPSLIAFMMLYQTVIATASVCFFPLLSELFSTSARYTGTALCYNVTYAIMGSLPIAVTAVIAYFESPPAAMWLLVAGALLTAVSVIRRPGELFNAKGEQRR